MEVKKRKAVNFDLDTDLLIKYHPSHTDKSAYGQIRNYMEQNGFVHRQYSGYHSEKRMTDTEVTYILQGLFNKYPWLDKCAKVVDITNIGRTHNFLDIREATIGLANEQEVPVNQHEHHHRDDTPQGGSGTSTPIKSNNLN